MALPSARCSGVGRGLASGTLVAHDSAPISEGKLSIEAPHCAPLVEGMLVRLKDPALIAKHPAFLKVLEVATKLLASLEATGFFSAEDAAAAAASTSASAADADAEKKGPEIEPPTSTLWCLFLLAQLEEYRGAYEEAIALLDRCIAHTPTAVDLYERRARCRWSRMTKL